MFVNKWCLSTSALGTDELPSVRQPSADATKNVITPDAALTRPRVPHLSVKAVDTHANVYDRASRWRNFPVARWLPLLQLEEERYSCT